MYRYVPLLLFIFTILNLTLPKTSLSKTNNNICVNFIGRFLSYKTFRNKNLKNNIIILNNETTLNRRLDKLEFNDPVTTKMLQIANLFLEKEVRIKQGKLLKYITKEIKAIKKELIFLLQPVTL